MVTINDNYAFEEKLRNARFLPSANRFRFNIRDFDSFTTYSSAVYLPCEKPNKFKDFMKELGKLVVKDEWIPKVVFVKSLPIESYKTPYTPQSEPIETTLDIFFENIQENGFTEEGIYSAQMIRSGLVKPFGNDWAVNFDQQELARAIENLFIGTNYLPLRASDFPHRFNLGLKNHSLVNRLEVYPKGVRYLGIDLVHIDTAARKVEEWIGRYPNLEYILAEGEKRLRLFQEWKRENPEPFLTEENVKPLPEKFLRGLRRIHEMTYGKIESGMKQIIKETNGELRKLRSYRHN